MMDNCLFCKIVRGEIPSRKVYEDDLVLTHSTTSIRCGPCILVIPKRHIACLRTSRADEPVLGRVLAVAHRLARENGSPGRLSCHHQFRRIGGQEVPHCMRTSSAAGTGRSDAQTS